ncbi:hypothetical protein ACWEP4_43695 [Streptomyces sp. NPDC004227]
MTRAARDGPCLQVDGVGGELGPHDRLAVGVGVDVVIAVVAADLLQAALAVGVPGPHGVRLAAFVVGLRHGEPAAARAHAGDVDLVDERVGVDTERLLPAGNDAVGVERLLHRVQLPALDAQLPSLTHATRAQVDWPDRTGIQKSAS